MKTAWFTFWVFRCPVNSLLTLLSNLQTLLSRNPNRETKSFSSGGSALTASIIIVLVCPIISPWDCINPGLNPLPCHFSQSRMSSSNLKISCFFGGPMNRSFGEKALIQFRTIGIIDVPVLQRVNFSSRFLIDFLSELAKIRIFWPIKSLSNSKTEFLAVWA